MCSESAPSFVHVLRRRAASDPDGTFFRFLHTGEIDGASVQVSWAEHEREARRIAARLQADGARGERVLLLYPPGPDFIGAFMGCIFAGAIAVPAFPPDPTRLARTLPRLQAIAEDARARFALAPQAICRMGASLQIGKQSALEWIASDTLPASLEDDWAMPTLNRDSLAFLQYTSGSTGTPRGVMVTHGNLLHDLALIHRCYGAYERMRAVFWLPVYHDMGLIGGLLGSMYTGTEVTLMSPLDFLRRPIRWLEAISRTGAAVSGGPDFAYRLCLRKVRDEELAQLDLSSWVVAFSGAEPVRAATLEAFADRFAVCGFDRRALYPTYGLAEGTLMVSGASGGPRAPVYFEVDAAALERGRVQPAGTARGQTLVSCGPVDSALSVAIVDPQTRARRAPHEIGEIWLRGPSVAAGYWDDVEATRALFRAGLAAGPSAGPAADPTDESEGGFLRTGDLGFCHDGELYVTGRLKDLLILRGRNVYPQDIEELAQEAHARVRPGCAAAFGIELDGEERVVLVAEIDDRGASFEPDEIIAAIRRHAGLGAELELHAVALLKRGTIPKTSSGKVQRHACKAAWQAGALEVIASAQEHAVLAASEELGAPPSDLAGAITSIRCMIATELRRPVSAVPIDEPLHALGLDSLRLVEITASLEQLFARPLETLTLFSYPTIEALAGFLIESAPSSEVGESRGVIEAAVGPYKQLAAACADIERRSTRYQFDLERDVAWDQLDAPGLYVPDAWLRELGFDVDGLAQRPEVFELLQWALALQVCATFELFEFGVIYFARDEADRLGRTRSVALLAEEEEKHIQLFRRYARHLRAQRPELAERLAALTVAGTEAIRAVLGAHEGDPPAQRHYAIWLNILFFEEYTVLFDKRLRAAEGIQPAWRSAHAVHRREEVQHIATDVRYLRALDLDEAARERISASFTQRLVEDFDRQFGIAGAQLLLEDLYPGLRVMVESPHRAERCLQQLLEDRTFAHSWAAAPFFRQVTALPPERVLEAAKHAAARERGRELGRERERERARAEPQASQAPRDQAEPIAIVGMGCRFPGSANSPDALWELLLAGFDAITEIPRDRWDVDAWFDPDPSAPGKMYTRWGGFVDHIREFDHGFFGITPKEARGMDPQQRMLLEVSWEALEHAGIPPSSLSGSAAGVFLGICSTDFSHRTLAEPIDAYSGTGTAFSVAAGRISYVLGLTGPCVAIDTACSSSLVAVHQACRALEARESDLVLAAGVNAILVPKSHIFFSALRAMSPVGRCKTFDASADGYVRSEGCGVVVLKRLADAERDGDRIFAVIRGSAVNQDGRSNGLTAPSGLAQAAVMRSALSRAGLSAEDVDYIEAHGTGTALGDPIELQAIGAVHRGRSTPVRLGSLKSQIGHSEGAAGIAGLIKAAMIAERGVIPANLHFHRPTPQVPWSELPVEVVTRVTPLGGRAVAVNSFGFGGTNAHVVIEPAAPELPGSRGVERPMHPVVISGHTPQALIESATRLAAALSDDLALEDVAHTLVVGRDHQLLRAGLFARDLEQARAGLVEIAAGDRSVDARQPPRVAFVFTGQGALQPGMGRALYDTQPVYRAVIDELATYFDPLLDRPLHALLFDAGAPVNDTALAQPALFCVELALASLWRAWGVVPRLVLGHSVGEIAAACFAGMISMADGAELVAARGRLMQALPRDGAMLAISADESTVLRAISAHGLALSVAAVNTATQVVVSGDEAAALELAARMAADGIEVRRLEVSHAFHSEKMRPMLAEFAALAERISFQEPSLPLISTVNAKLEARALGRAAYWVEHVMATVRFADGLDAAIASGVDTLIEIGPRPTLLGLAAKHLGEACTLLPSLWPPRDDWDVLGESLCRLHCRGASIDWPAFDAPYARRRVTLPTQVFMRQRAWTEEAPSLAAGVACGHPLLGVRLDVAGRDVFESTLSTTRTSPSAWLGDHRVVERVVVPATAWLELLRAGAREVTGSVAVALSSAEILRAMLLDEGEHRRVQVVVEARGDRLVVEAFGREDDARWVVHARAWVVHAHAGAEHARHGDHAGPGLDPAQLPESLDPGEVFAALEAVGLDYGPRFRALRAIRRGVDHRGERAVLAELALPDDVPRWTQGMHPILVDAALQAASALVETHSGALSLPVKAGRYGLFAEVSGVTQVLAHVTKGIDGVDILLSDLAGRPLAELAGVQLRDADPGIFRQRRRQHDRDTAFALRWDPAPRTQRGEIEGRWVVVGDDALADALAARLGEITEVARIEPGLLADDQPAAVLDAARGVIFVAPSLADPSQLAPVLAPGLRLAQERVRGSIGSLTIVTRGALASAADAVIDETALASASLWGLGRTLQQEGPGCRLIDLDPQTDLEDAVATLLGELPHTDEDQLMFRAGRRLAARLVRAVDPRLSLPESGSWRLAQRERGVLDSLEIEPVERTQPGPGEVEVAVEAAGLNFRDVLGALGMLPGPARSLGGEFAGRVTAIGTGVTQLEVGDAVMGMAASALARHLITDARLVIRRPAGLDAAAGATIPAAFLTAWYGLYELAQLRAGEWCLIHAAAGGVGMAAVQLARRIGARVIGTASPRKWDAVRGLGVTQVFNSRVSGWAPEIRDASGGHGIDVVLNSLTGEFIHDSFAALAEHGRFIEMGKAEIWDDARVREVHPSARYQAFDLLAVEPAQIQRMLQAIVAALEAGEIVPLPRQAFPITQATAAFRTMAQARHVGKLVLTSKDAEAQIDPDGTWLITGGFGGLGRQLVGWLIEHGVRRLALASRSEPEGERRAFVEALAARGVEVRIIHADLRRSADVEALVAEVVEHMPPLRAVVHAAGVLDDGPLTEQSWPRFEAVLGPKAGAAWALHRATRELSLDALVLFSSIAGSLGGPGQANYAAANAFLDGLAQHRRGLGCAGVSIVWGPWAGEGMAARLDARLQRRLADQGLQLIDRALGLEWFGRALGSDAGQVIVAPLDLARIRRRLGSGPTPPLLSILVPPSAGATGPVLAEELRRLVPEVRHARLVAVLRQRSARVMGAAGPEAVDPSTPLRDLGLDSLMGVDLHAELSRSVGRRLDETLLLDHPTLDRLATHLLEVLGLAAQLEAEVAVLAGPAEPAEPEANADTQTALARELAAIEALLA